MKRNLLSLDTETTGLDIRHGCRPFMLQLFDGCRDPDIWEWDVDPETREVSIPSREIHEIRKRIKGSRLVIHNAKFDILACASIGIDLPDLVGWDNIEDTLVGSHVLSSGEPHGLKEQSLLYLDQSDADQAALREAVNAARRYGRKYGWRIAQKEDPHSPGLTSAPKVEGGEGWWVMDMWLPRAVALDVAANPKRAPKTFDPSWETVARNYGGTDVLRGYFLWLLQEEALTEEKLWRQYKVKKDLLRITYGMESRGFTLKKDRLTQFRRDAKKRSEEAHRKACKIGNLENLDSPKQLQEALFENLGLTPVRSTKRGYSTDKDTLKALKETATGNALEFLEALTDYRTPKTSLRYLENYKRVAFDENGYLCLHPLFNVTGTDTTRFSSQDPNAQNIDKLLRACFGPREGRVWIAADFSNIELRIFAYESQDPNLLEGYRAGLSMHHVVAQVLYPREYAECERKGLRFEEVYKKTLYQWVKNGNFSLIYGAGKTKADATFHVVGAYDRIRRTMPRIDDFMRQKHAEAKAKGYITTLGGYRLDVPVSEPHKAVNYFVQGSAGWMLCEAMVAVDAYLRTQEDHHLILTVHDELDFDFPADDWKTPTRKVRDIMESIGPRYGIPIPVDVELHRDNWGKGEEVTFKHPRPRLELAL